MITTLNMSSYEIEQDETAIEYDEEILLAGWNPAVDLAGLQLQEVGTEKQEVTAARPVIFEASDAAIEAESEVLMRKLCSYQH